MNKRSNGKKDRAVRPPVDKDEQEQEQEQERVPNQEQQGAPDTALMDECSAVNSYLGSALVGCKVKVNREQLGDTPVFVVTAVKAGPGGWILGRKPLYGRPSEIPPAILVPWERIISVEEV